jgi:hypothetical protein
VLKSTISLCLQFKAPLTMPDQKDKQAAGWAMPEPVFRSSEGRSMKADADAASELPTEPADRDLGTSDGTGFQSVRPKPNRRVRHMNKRRKSFWERNAAGLIVLGVCLIGLLLYLAWIYGRRFL